MENLVIRKLRGAFAAKQSRGQFWKSVPDSSVGLFCVAVFTLFATLGFLTLMMRTSKLPLAEICIYSSPHRRLRRSLRHSGH